MILSCSIMEVCGYIHQIQDLSPALTSTRICLTIDGLNFSSKRIQLESINFHPFQGGGVLQHADVVFDRLLQFLKRKQPIVHVLRGRLGRTTGWGHLVHDFLRRHVHHTTVWTLVNPVETLESTACWILG